MNKFTKSALLLSAAAIMGFAVPAHAQVTTSEISGVITDDNGAPISNATISIVNTATGFARTLTADSNGRFALRNLSVSGRYSISVTGDGYQGERVEDVVLSLGDATSLNFDLSSAGTTDEIIVVGQRQVIGNVTMGPNAVFSLSDLQNAPAINRDIKDVIRLDPRIYIDESFGDAIQCAGANPRFNSLTVDGVRMNDNFGLNSNGYPTERMPFSFDAIEQVSVELAPFDVQYGGFTACNINAVTKSGTNEFHGGAFFDYTTASLKGDVAGGLDISNDGFNEHRYGLSVGGPIIKDKLFFFASYEKLKGSNLFGSNTAAGTGIAQAEYDEIIAIASGQYGYVSGGLPATQDNFDEKLLIKLDWNINNNHRASFTYNYNDGNNISGSDTGTNRLSDGNHFYERGAALNSFSGTVFSNWTDNLSTEVSMSYLDLKNRQESVAGVEFGEIQIRNIGPRGTTVYLGADDSRHANKLTYDLTTYRAKANYTLGDHTLSAGVEHEAFNVFNLFIQEVQGEWVFNSINDFRNGDFSDFRYENAAGSNDQNDGAASFGFGITSLYAQDEWQATDRLNIIAGLRWDFHSSDDLPTANATFQNNHGFTNARNLDGKGILQPRFGFNYEVNDRAVVHGGFGLFSGGNPNVWLSNNYSNNGVTLFEYRVRGGNINNFVYPNSGNPFFDVPQAGIDAVAAAQGGGAVNAVAPGFKLPSEWKFALGTNFVLDAGRFGSDYDVSLDVLYSKAKAAATIRNLELTQTDTAPDGRPIYSGAPFNDFVLTNSNEKGDSLVLSASIAKEYDNGLNWSLAYAYTDASDVNPMTSSVAFSNDKNIAVSDAINPGLATTNYEIKHRFTFNVNYQKDFFEDLTTTFSMFGSVSDGRPYSYVYRRNGVFEGFYNSSRELFYVPTDANDSRVIWANASERDDFFNWLPGQDLNNFRGEIAPRNAFSDDWWAKVDLKIKQEFPGFRSGDRASAFIVLENALNFIDSDWGVLRQHSFPNTAQILNVAYSSATNQYTYSGFDSSTNPQDGSVNAAASSWEVRFGVNYNF
ncbi:MAG: cell envelope biogenesis protein OmpA [Robiginitomaculum sp.]|nr:MAG: cell envelope biogenesis protein OmpA [Robiginitomaculum sp.]